MNLDDLKAACLLIGWIVIVAGPIVVASRDSELKRTSENKLLSRMYAILIGIAFLITSK